MTSQMHWSRWGDPAMAQDLAPAIREMLTLFLGDLSARPSVDLPAVSLPEVELDAPALDALRDIVGAENVLTDHETRVRRTRGKSTPDLLKLRAGDGADAPDVVVRPASHEEINSILAWADAAQVAVVPFGGGTSVVGGLTARRDGYAGVVALDLVRMKRVLDVDTVSMTATLEPGLLGPEAEAALQAHGVTIGHHPQSFEYASIGGFAVTRSSGQASSGYGRFDALVVGLKVATPIGDLDLGNSPANAAGPDLRELIMGSEGAFGVVTQVKVRVRPVPTHKVYEGWRFPDFESGAAAMRALVQAGENPTVLRLSDELETAVNLAKPDEVGAESGGGCLMLVGFEGSESKVARQRDDVSRLLTEARGVGLGEQDGDAWQAGRYHGPYLRDALLDVGVLVETAETVTFWSNIPRLYAEVKAAFEQSLTEQGTPPIILCHISHVYETGCSLYFTIVAKELPDGIGQWQTAKAAGTAAMVRAGGSVTHHHAVGVDHKPWYAEEIGPVGVEILRAVKQRVDPRGILNPGILIP